MVDDGQATPDLPAPPPGPDARWSDMRDKPDPDSGTPTPTSGGRGATFPLEPRKPPPDKKHER